ncbi:hypothetical protein Patl1_03202 [Pistacia atlantica]|uniref:Uncharacterized protein n=1 Tax=Pistacia atlantica TaxID=434234 RepID=A0ACC1CDF1_9ROSI|nr:hypothetical protein Patl1_03202 [Pistacia atlantica]
MDKGKIPLIQDEEEDFLSVFDDLPQGIMSDLDGTGFAKETPLVGEMDGNKEDFFSKFLTMNFNENSSNVEVNFKAPTPNSGISPVAQPPPNPRLPRLPRTPKLSLQTNPRAQRRSVKTKPYIFRKTMPREELEKLAIHDPKRAKRIITNRQSALRAKERKKLYIFMLEHRLTALHSKSTEMASELTLLETESESLNSENAMLKSRIDMAKQQVHLQDALNDQIKSQILHMKAKLMRPKVAPNYGGAFDNPFPGNTNPAMMNAPLAAQQFPQLQVQHPYQQQQQKSDFQQPNLGQLNYGGQYEQGEPSQPQPQPQQLQQLQQNPQPSYMEQLLAVEKSAPSLSEIYK